MFFNQWNQGKDSGRPARTNRGRNRARRKTNVREDIQPELLKSIRIHYVRTIDEVLSLAFSRPVLRVVSETQPRPSSHLKIGARTIPLFF